MKLALIVPAFNEEAYGDGFALCVLPVDDDSPAGETIRERLRVDLGRGIAWGRPLSGYKFVRKAEDAARQPCGGVELEIIEGQARFQIGRTVWEVDVWASGRTIQYRLNPLRRDESRVRNAGATFVGAATDELPNGADTWFDDRR